MDTKKFIKPCPQCGSGIEPKRCATSFDYTIGGIAGVLGGTVGFFCGGPFGAAIGGALGYKVAKWNTMSIADESRNSQLFKYKCPNCGKTWKEELYTNDNPEDPSWISRAAGM